MKSWGYALIAALAVMVVIAGIGGYLVGVSRGRTQAADVRRQFLAERLGTGNNNSGAMAGYGNWPGQAAGDRPVASGTVKSVEGNTVTVTTRNGDVKVELAGNVVVNKFGPGTLQDIQPGLRITVMGESSSGTVTANSVQLMPAAGQ